MILPVAALFLWCADQARDVAPDVVKEVSAILFVDEVKDFVKSLKQTLTNDHALPQTQELLRRVRTAELVAAQRVAEAYRERLNYLPDFEKNNEQDIFVKRLGNSLADALKLNAKNSIDVGALSKDSIGPILDEMVNTVIVEVNSASAASSRKILEAAFLAELEKDTGCKIPSDFHDLFTGDDSAAGGGWYNIVALNISEAIATNERFRSLLFAAKMTSIQQSVFEINARVSAFQFQRVPSIGVEVTDVLTGIKLAADELLKNQKSEAEKADHRHRQAMEADARRTEEHRKLREEIAREKGVAAELLVPLFEELGQVGLSLDEIRTKAPDAIAAIREKARQQVEASNDGQDIEATIRAARAKLGLFDTAGSRQILADKIAEEKVARLQRLKPLLEEQAAVQRLTYDYSGAIKTLIELLELDPDKTWSWIDLGDICKTTGAPNDAIANFGKAVAAAERRVKAAPGNTELQRDLSVAHGRIGHLRFEQGDFAAALDSYEAALAIRESLAATHPGDTQFQRDLSSTQRRIGDVQLKLGDSTAALNSYQAALTISKRLAEAHPSNAEWQNNLSLSYHRIGDVQRDQGDSTAARSSYQAALTISERLAKADPGNLEWQQTLAVSDLLFGDFHRGQDDLTTALNSYDAGLTIMECLSAKDPANTILQHDLSVFHDRVADVQRKQHDYPAALKSHRASLSIWEHLATADPGDASLQRALQRSRALVGIIEAVQGQSREDS